MEAETQLTTDANGDATLPTDFIEMRSVKDSQGRVLSVGSLNALTALYNNRAGVPTEFAVVGSTFKVKPIAAATFDIVYYQDIPSLAANGTNWLLTRAPDVYLYATAIEVSAWAGNAEAFQAVDNLLQTAISQLIIDDERGRFSLGQVQLSGVSP